MERETAAEIFRREKEERDNKQYVLKNITEKPTKAGVYNVEIEGVRTFAPQFLKFDGENWVDLTSISDVVLGDTSRISYYDEPPARKLKM